MRSRRSRHVAGSPVPPNEAASTERPAAFDADDRPAVVQLRDTGLEQVLDDVQRQLNQGRRSLVVDMSGVRESTSTTISALLWIKRRCAARGVEPVLRRLSRRSTDVLERVGLLAVLMVEQRDGPEGARTHRAPSRRE